MDARAAQCMYVVMLAGMAVLLIRATPYPVVGMRETFKVVWPTMVARGGIDRDSAFNVIVVATLSYSIMMFLLIVTIANLCIAIVWSVHKLVMEW